MARRVRIHAADTLADAAGLFLAERTTGNEAMLGEALRLYLLAQDEDA